MNAQEMKDKGIEFFGLYEKTGNSVNLRIKKAGNLFFTREAMEIISRLVKDGSWDELLAKYQGQLPDYKGRRINRLKERLEKLSQENEVTETVVETQDSEVGDAA